MGERQRWSGRVMTTSSHRDPSAEHAGQRRSRCVARHTVNRQVITQENTQ